MKWTYIAAALFITTLTAAPASAAPLDLSSGTDALGRVLNCWKG
jgi:hypothetical protein